MAYLLGLAKVSCLPIIADWWLIPAKIVMPHLLEQKIAAVRRRVRRVLVIDAAARSLAIGLAVALVLTTADYLLHFGDFGLRWLSSLTMVAACGFTFYRFVWPVLRARLSDVGLALELERRLPILRDRLASALRFLRQSEDDVLAGSASLRRTVIAEATAEIDRLNLEEAVEPHAVWRSLWPAAVPLALVVAAVAYDPSAAGTALARLVCPWSDRQWPRQNHLAFVKPLTRLAAGQTFEVELIDAAGARLPDEVFIQYRFDDESPAESRERMRLVNDSLVARKEHVTRSFSYRAVGGDDFSMPWTDLEIVEPPEIEKLAIRLRFPPYTGWPDETAEPHLRALVGTRVELNGRVNKPMSAAKIHVDDSAPIAARLSNDGRGFVLAGEDHRFTVERSGSYWIELVDADGFSSGDQVRYEIRAVEDFTPTVNIERLPATGFITPAARMPVHVVAKDDLALEQVALRMSRSDRSEEEDSETILYQGPAEVVPSKKAQVESGDAREIDFLLDAAALGLKPATQITLYATAADYYPHRGQSEPHRLTVITSDELRERLAERQNTIVGELSRILKLQRDARALIAGAQIQLDQVGHLAKADLDRLQGAELIQRQVERGLVGPTEGVLGQIGSLLDDLRNNQIDSPDVARQMQSVFDEVDRLGRDELPPLDGELTAALKAARVDAGEEAAAERANATRAPLRAVGRHQQEVIDTLDRLTGALAESDNYRRFHREISTLQRQQQDIQRDAREQARHTLTKELSKLSAQERADLEKLAARQLDLAREFDKIQQRMQRTADEAAGRDPLSAGSISDALAQSREQGLSQRMHEAGREIAANRFGQAIEAEQRVSEGLREMLDILANRREHEIDRLVKKLREAGERLNELRQEQHGLQKKWRAAADEDDAAARRRELERLTREQQQTAEATERLARALERLQAERAGQKASQGRASMDRAGSQGQQDQAAAAADAAEQADRNLEEAEQELARRLAQAEADLAQEQMARLEDHLKALLDGERKLLEETRHYADVEHSQGELTRAQAVSVGDLGKQQQSLVHDTTDVANKLTTPVFRLAFAQAARQMQRAAELLEKRETAQPTQQAQERAIDLIAHAVEALKRTPRDQPQQPPEENGEEGEQPGQQNGSGGDASQMLAEMKLLKWMQDDVNRRTKALDEAHRDAGELSPEAQSEYRELSEQQGLIAELILKLSGMGETPDKEPAEGEEGMSEE